MIISKVVGSVMSRKRLQAFALSAVCLAAFLGMFSRVLRAQNTASATQKQKAELYVQAGHAGEIGSIAFSPDSKTLASTGGDKTTKLWDIQSGRELKTLVSSGNFVAFSTHGKVLASGSDDNTIKLWDVESGKLLHTLKGHSYSVRNVVFSRDSKMLASWTGADTDVTIRLWNAETGQSIKSLPGQNSRIYAVVFSPDGKTLASGSEDGAIKLWDVNSKQELHILKEHTKYVTSLAFSSDSKTLISGSFDRTVKLWNVGSGRVKGQDNNVYSVSVSPDGKTLAFVKHNKSYAPIIGGVFGAKPYEIRLWDLERLEEITTLRQTEWIDSVAISPDGKTIAWATSGENGKKIQLGDVEGRGRSVPLKNPDAIRSFAFSPNSKTLASLGGGSAINLWDVESGNLFNTLKGHTAKVSNVAFSSDGKTIASQSDDEAINLWDIESGKLSSSLEGNTVNDSLLGFSPDGKILAGGSNGETLTSGTRDYTIKLWDVKSGKLLNTLKGLSASVDTVSFSPDGQKLASASSFFAKDQTVKLWDVKSAKLLTTLEGHEDSITSLAFSSDNKTLASGSGDYTIKLWNVNSGTPLSTLSQIGLKVGRSTISGTNLLGFSPSSLAFSPDGKTLVGGNAFYAITWDLERGKAGKTYGDFSPMMNPDTKLEISAVAPDFYQHLYQPLTADGRFRIKLGDNSKLDLYDYKTDKLIASLIKFDKTDWAVVTPDGLFDGSPNAWNLLSWRLSDKLYDIAPIEAFFSEFYRPNLLKDIFGGRNIERPTRDISMIDTRQPEVKVKFGSLSPKETLKAFIQAIQKKEVGGIKKILSRGTLESLDVVAKAQKRTLDEQIELELLRDSDNDNISDDRKEKLLSGTRNERIEGNKATIEVGDDRLGWSTMFFVEEDGNWKMELEKSIEESFSPKTESDDGNSSGGGDRNSVYVTARQVTIVVEVRDAPANENRSNVSGAKDVRLFRNGTLVKLWSGDVLRGKNSVTLTAIVPIISGANEFTAYAFNNDNVKTADATLNVTGADSLKRQGTLYILAVGVGKYANPNYNLDYTPDDATSVAAQLKLEQEKLARYQRVEARTLLDEQAKRENILAELKKLFGIVQPEDAVVVYFSGHGKADGDHFYLIPHDLGYSGSRDQLSAEGLQQIIRHSISDVELEEAFRGIDAGQIFMIIDACNSGQALENKDEPRRGPMNTRGLAQLAYEKGMYIMAASQNVEEAFVSEKLKHSYLTFALVEEGLKTNLADENQDGQVTLREWFDYASTRVPKLRDETLQSKSLEEVTPQVKTVRAQKSQTPRPFYRREIEAQPFVVAKP